MHTPICLATLGELDGGASRAIVDAAIRDAIRDLDDRGDDGKPRTVAVVLTLVRLDNGLVAAHVEAEAKVPRRRTAGTLGAIRHDAGQSRVLFQPHAPDDPHQRTIDERLPGAPAGRGEAGGD